MKMELTAAHRQQHRLQPALERSGKSPSHRRRPADPSAEDRQDRQNHQHAGHDQRRFVRRVCMGVVPVAFVGVRISLIEMNGAGDQVIAGVLRF